MTPRRICANTGCNRPARYRTSWGNGNRMGSDRDHDLCPECATAEHDRSRARNLALRLGGPVDLELVRRLKVYLDPTPVFTTVGDEDAFYQTRKLEREALILELDRILRLNDR